MTAPFWRVGETAEHDTVIVDPDDDIVATVHVQGPPDRHDATLRYRAEILASAPEMLSALRTLCMNAEMHIELGHAMVASETLRELVYNAADQGLAASNKHARVTMPDDPNAPSMRGKMSEPRYGCPYCGSEEIEEVNEVIAWYPVTAWTEEGDPAEFGVPSYGDGEAVHEAPYLCRRCLSQAGGRAFHFDEPKRLEPSAPQSRRARLPWRGLVFLGFGSTAGRLIFQDDDGEVPHSATKRFLVKPTAKRTVVTPWRTSWLVSMRVSADLHPPPRSARSRCGPRRQGWRASHVRRWKPHSDRPVANSSRSQDDESCDLLTRCG